MFPTRDVDNFFPIRQYCFQQVTTDTNDRLVDVTLLSVRQAEMPKRNDHAVNELNNNPSHREIS